MKYLQLYESFDQEDNNENQVTQLGAYPTVRDMPRQFPVDVESGWPRTLGEATQQHADYSNIINKVRNCKSEHEIKECVEKWVRDYDQELSEQVDDQNGSEIASQILADCGIGHYVESNEEDSWIKVGRTVIDPMGTGHSVAKEKKYRRIEEDWGYSETPGTSDGTGENRVSAIGEPIKRGGI